MPYFAAATTAFFPKGSTATVPSREREKKTSLGVTCIMRSSVLFACCYHLLLLLLSHKERLRIYWSHCDNLGRFCKYFGVFVSHGSGLDRVKNRLGFGEEQEKGLE